MLEIVTLDILQILEVLTLEILQILMLMTLDTTDSGNADFVDTDSGDCFKCNGFEMVISYHTFASLKPNIYYFKLYQALLYQIIQY